MKIYVLSNPVIDMTGTDVPVLTWDEISGDRHDKLVIHYEPRRWLGRHEIAERKRPYCVRFAPGGRWGWPASYHATLMAAVKAAERLSRETT